MAAYRYELVTVLHGGHEERRELDTEAPLNAGDVVPFGGSHWIVDRVESSTGARPRLIAYLARYRLVLRHLEGEEEVGDLRDYREDGPNVGYAFETSAEGEKLSWLVVEQRLARDEGGEPVLELVAERDYTEEEEEEEVLQ